MILKCRQENGCHFVPSLNMLNKNKTVEGKRKFNICVIYYVMNKYGPHISRFNFQLWKNFFLPCKCIHWCKFIQIFILRMRKICLIMSFGKDPSYFCPITLFTPLFFNKAYFLACSFCSCCSKFDSSGLVFSTFNMLGENQPGLTGPISWLLMPWLLSSPDYQQPWYWICKLGKSFSYMRKDFEYLGQFSIKEL